MNIYITKKVVKEVDVVMEDYTQCDKCGDKIEVDEYDVFECHLVHKSGERYPEGGNGEENTMDLCQKCTTDLMVLLYENGYNVNKGEWDY